MEAMLRHGFLRTTLATGPTALLAGLLRHCRRQLSQPQHARGAIAVAQHLMSCSAGIADDAMAHAQVERLAAAVFEELQVQEHLLALLGLVNSLCIS